MTLMGPRDPCNKQNSKKHKSTQDYEKYPQITRNLKSIMSQSTLQNPKYSISQILRPSLGQLQADLGTTLGQPQDNLWTTSEQPKSNL